MLTAALEPAPSDLVPQLHSTLLDLVANPYPEIPSPDNVKKRASVALIIRIQPHYSHWPEECPDSTDSVSSPKERIDHFFRQQWVRYGDPEVLFIKRAARQGDRWTSHVALPGGRRDPEDESDFAAAVRETLEEVGVTLDDTSSIAVGNLAQRLVTTSWGKVPLMILCPYIFLLTTHNPPPLRLQPTEVNSAHWVSLRALLFPALRTFEYQDVSNRLAKQEMGIKRWILRAMLGRMLFAAIRLVPSASTYCSSVPDFLPTEGKAKKPWWTVRGLEPPSTAKPLLLWGLTLGIMADFLELLPPYDALALWTYPTFSPPDVRFTLWALSYSFRRKKRMELEEVISNNTRAIEQGLDGVRPPQMQKSINRRLSEVGIGGLGVGKYTGPSGTGRHDSRSSAVGLMLEGYYDIVRRAVTIALVGRTSLVLAIVIHLWHKYKRR